MKYISRDDPTVTITDPTIDESGRRSVGPGYYVTVAPQNEKAVREALAWLREREARRNER